MTTTYVQIGSIQEFQDRMEMLGRDGAEMFQKAMHDALNGTVRTEIKRQTPLATTRRYAYTYDKTGKKTGRRVNPPFDRTSGGVKALRNSFRCEIKGNDEVQIGHTAPYAIYVHEAKKPVEGDYWKPGKKGGWTTQGTGPKFVQKSLEKHADDIPEWAIKGIDKRMKDEGIF